MTPLLTRSFVVLALCVIGAVYVSQARFNLDNGAEQVAAVSGTRLNNTSLDHTPKLRPGEWRDIRMLRGSEVSPGQRARVTRQLQLHLAKLRAGAPEWEFKGPENIGGRVVDIAVDPTTAGTLYAAAASGGIWKSTDAGDTFSRTWPNENAQSMGAIAMTSTGRLYAGTGESNPGGGSLTYGNAGVFSSIDGGESWQSLGLQNSERISRIAVDPNNESTLFVAATGPLYNPGGERGLFRSTDAGLTWVNVLAGDNDTTGASDVHIDPSNSQRVYAAMWDHLREPALRRYGGEGSGIFRSDDGGDTWQRLGLANGLPAVSDDVGRVSMAVSASNPQVMYAMYLTTRGFFSAFYRSTNGGDNWTAISNDGNLVNSQSSFGWWFARIWVDPADEDHVFVAGVPLVVSNDGGVSFTVSGGVHADQHAMAWDPNANNRVYLGNDGGVYRSDFNGNSNWVFASQQPFTQFYTLDVAEGDAQRIVGGTQDNRCLRSYTSDDLEWNTFGNCGDGLEVLINPLNQQIVYSCAQYGFCSKSINGGDSGSNIGATDSVRRNWQTPLLFDPTNPAIMYYAGEKLNRSIDGGDSWTTISPDLTGGDPFPSPVDPYPYGTITTVAVGAGNPNSIMLGTDDGRIWASEDTGVTWTQSTGANLPDRWVSRVIIDPINYTTAYVAYSGFRNGDNTPYVFKTDDFGISWTDITTDLPSAPVNALALSTSGQLIVGNDVGVFKRQPNEEWISVGPGLPVVPVTDLRVHPASESLLVSTFGRGIWSISLIEDTDGDGVLDAQDNCLNVANAQQVDTDSDGYGNACDADFDQSCAINFVDLNLLSDQFLSSEALYDLDGDGVVNFVDVALFVQMFLSAPGPSGTGGICEIDE